MSNGGWVGVDLDGTLAFYGKWEGIEHIGDPVMPMLERVKIWLAQGIKVKIFTARVVEGEKAVGYIREWLKKVGLPEDMEITNVKDFSMIELWDDRVVAVLKNTGMRMN